MKRILKIIFALCFLSVELWQGPLLAKDIAPRQQPKNIGEKENFIGLFHRADPEFTVISDQATEYIMACCEDRDAALQLLHKNGFEVHVASEPADVERLNRHYDQSKRSWAKEYQIEYDEFISGTRGPGPERFWRFLTKYNIALFIENGKVFRVYAEVNTTYP